MRFFGEDRDEMWRKLANRMGARYVDGGFWKGDKIEATHDSWTITLETYFDPASKITYTRFRAPFESPDEFRFTIYRKGLFSELGKKLGMQDVEVGHARFDEAFIIKGNDEAKLRALFENDKVRNLLETQPKVHLSVAKGNVLTFQVAGVVKELDRLKGIFDLLGETLDTLARMGSAR